MNIISVKSFQSSYQLSFIFVDNIKGGTGKEDLQANTIEIQA